MKYLACLIVLSLPLAAQTATYRHDGQILLPDATVTPGAIRTSDTHELCDPAFRTKPFRKTTAAMKKKVCQEYGAKNCPNVKLGEIDHLTPLELGGLDDVKNLWWQPTPQYHQKDKVENWVKKQVCAGKMDLEQAQKQMIDNWYVLFQDMSKHPD